MKAVIKFVLKYINVKPMIKELVDVHLEKFVMDAVAKSKTKIDDAVVPLMYSALEKQALDSIEKLDLEAMFKLNEEEKA